MCKTEYLSENKEDKSYYKKTSCFDKSVSYYKNNNRHREDGPAIIQVNGNQEWWLNGIRHREDGPAILSNNGEYEQWFLYDKRHRDNDLPAIINTKNSVKEWWFNGQRHRVGGPAFISDSETSYWKNGLCHRLNAPALKMRENQAESRSYFEFGKQVYK
jgi:hypothetical protein